MGHIQTAKIQSILDFIEKSVFRSGHFFFVPGQRVRSLISGRGPLTIRDLSEEVSELRGHHFLDGMYTLIKLASAI